MFGCGSIWLKWSLFQEASLSILPYLNGAFHQRLARLTTGAKSAARWARYGAQDVTHRQDWFTLLNILFDTMSHSSTDARDRVYALLNFVPSVGIVPDYREPVEAVFK